MLSLNGGYFDPILQKRAAVWGPIGELLQETFLIIV